MIPFSELRDRAERALVRLVAPPPTAPASGPAEPFDTARGLTGVCAPNAEAETPALPPEGSRAWHRLGWFTVLARTEPASAVGRLRVWLATDVPGVGPAWEHSSDAAVRLAHLAVGLTWLGAVEPGLLAAAAGSVRWHLRWLSGRMPMADLDGTRAVAHHAGLVIGGFLFPELPESGAARAQGLTGLRFVLPRQIHADGSSRDLSPRTFAQVLMLVALARTVTRANGAVFPADADAALVAGARFLDRLEGDLGRLPSLGNYATDEVLPGGGPLGQSLWSVVVGAGLDRGAAAPDARAAWLGGVPQASGAEPSSASSWAMWSWREAGLVAAFMKIKGQPARVVAAFGAPRSSSLNHRAPLSFSWDLGALSVIADPGCPGDDPGAEVARGAVAHGSLQVDGRPDPTGATLDISRVDGKKARIEGHHDAWRLSRWPIRHERDLLLNQARLVCSDRLEALRGPGRAETVRLCWQLGPGFSVERTDTGFTAKNGSVQVIIQLPSALVWAVETGGPTFGRVWTDAGWVSAPALVGTGEVAVGVELVSSFEVR